MTEKNKKEIFIIQENPATLISIARSRVKNLANLLKSNSDFKYQTIKDIEKSELKRKILNTTYYDKEPQKFKVLRDIWDSRENGKINLRNYVSKHFNQANNRVRIPESEFMSFLYDSNVTEEYITSKYCGYTIKILDAEETIKAYRQLRSCMTNQRGLLTYINEKWAKVYGLLKGGRVFARAVVIQGKIVRVYSASHDHRELFYEMMKKYFPEIIEREKINFLEHIRENPSLSIIDYNEKIKEIPKLEAITKKMYSYREIPYDDSGVMVYTKNKQFVLALDRELNRVLLKNPKLLKGLYDEEKYGKCRLLQKKYQGEVYRQRIFFERCDLIFDLPTRY